MENNYGNRSYQDRFRNRDSHGQNRNWDNDDRNSDRDRRLDDGWNNERNRYNSYDRNNDNMENNYSSRYNDMNSSYGSNYGSGSSNRNDEGRYGGSDYNQWNRGINYGNSGYYGSSDYNRDYRSNRYNDNDRHMGHDRDWWDRTSDEISSWFGDDDAKRRRRMDKIMGPHRGKGPKGYTRPDEKIREDVNEKLYHDSHIDASDIELSVSGGEVTLSGTVENKFAKRHAEDLAETVVGVSDVTNNLKVNKTTSSYNTGTTNTDTSSSVNRSGMNGITDNNDTNRRRTTSSV